MKKLMIAALALAASGAMAQPVSPVRLNQIGLLPDGAKTAIVPSASTRPLDWRLTGERGEVVARGKTKVFGRDRWSGEHVHRIDFSDVASPGTGYRLSVGGASSRPFVIAPSVYERLPYDALAYFYHNRAGTPIEARLVGERWARPAGHPAESATCVAGADSNGNVWPGCSYSLDVTGGWYDAGDHGKYVVNGGISLWTLLNLHERNMLRGGSAIFADSTAAIPETGNGISDLLDEARWEMEFLLKMQVPQGSRVSVPVGVRRNAKGLRFEAIDASGMAHHKVADANWTALPMRPDRDPERRQLFPPSTGATLNLAATAAQCARIWRGIDPAFADRCLAAARSAWAAAVRNPQVYPIADFTGSGGYGDSDFSDEFYWAAAELLATTGDAEFRSFVERSPHFRAQLGDGASWASVAPLGTVTLALLGGAGEAEKLRLQSVIRAASDRFLRERQQVGYAIPFAARWPWGSTSSLLNRAMLLALAHDFSGEQRYRDGVIDLMDFILGRNPLDQSFVSGYGARPMRNPHHRFWAHSMDSEYPPPPPGALSGGPNQNTSQDDAAKAVAGCAPQACWVDDIRSFSMNEVAINWNAPLVWVSAWLAQSRDAKGERG